jgi:hypothetical protein
MEPRGLPSGLLHDVPDSHDQPLIEYQQEHSAPIVGIAGDGEATSFLDFCVTPLVG